MSMPHTITLTTRDFSVLERLLEQGGVRVRPLVEELRRKLRDAVVVMPADVDPHVCTINSRVRFHVAGGEAEERTIIASDLEQTMGLTLPVWVPRGLAMLGLSAGAEVVVKGFDGSTETLTLDAVEYQPEGRLRAAEPAPAPTGGRVLEFRPAPRRRELAKLGGDDPGPSAA